MTQAQKNQLAVMRQASEIKSRQLEIRALPDEQITTELRAEQTALEAKALKAEVGLRSAIDAVGAEQAWAGAGGEDAERRALVERADFGNYIGAALAGRPLGGVEKELNASYSAEPQHGGVAVPWAALAGRQAAIEKRADTITSLPADGNHTVESEYVGRLFANSASEFLMVRPVMLPAGSESIPVISAGPTAEYFAGSAVADADAATVEFKKADPTRLQAAVLLRAADIQRSPGLAAAIQNDLAEAVREAADKKIIDQLFTDLTDATDSTATLSYGNFVSTLAGGVDGRAASGLGQIRALLGVDTYKVAAGKISTNGDLSAIDYATGRAGGIMASALMPAKSGSLQKGLIAKSGAPGSAASVWFGAGELLVDPWTNSPKGERRITLLSFHQALTLRSAAFAEASFKLS